VQAQAELELRTRRGNLTASRYNWPNQARPNQLPAEGSWTTWLLLAGRGFRKTRTGAEYVRMQIEQEQAQRVALIAPTAADARDVMVEGRKWIVERVPTVEPPNVRTIPNGG
jgi:Uncharacterized conserved protein